MRKIATNQLRILLQSWCNTVVVRGGTADFKVGVQNRICERSEWKIFFVPHFSKCGVQASKYHV